MESYSFLLVLAIILLSTKLFGLATEKVHLPQVVGALISGIVLGPSVLGILHETDFLVKTSEIGVIIMMFIAGLDTDINELKSAGKSCFIVALLGIIVPVIFCGGLYYFYFDGANDAAGILKAAFAGVIFSATSVSITIETLNELGKMKTRAGSTILGAALIDDIIGIILLSIITSLSSSQSGEGGGLTAVVLKIIGFFVFTAVVGLIVHKLFKDLDINHGKSRRVAVWGLAFCFVMAYCSETFFGVADITGAYFAGAILCNITKTRKFIAKKMTVASYIIFSPVFFAGIGIKTDVTGLTGNIIVFAVILSVFAIATKIIGCGFGAKLCGLEKKESLTVGAGMVARGEVALMVAKRGMSCGMIESSIFPAIVLAVIATTLLTPIILKAIVGNGEENTSEILSPITN